LIDEKKHMAVLQATKRLLALNTSDSEIVESLKELGLSEEEAGKVISEAKQDKSIMAEAQGEREKLEAKKGSAEQEASESPAKEEEQEPKKMQEQGKEQAEQKKQEKVDFNKQELSVPKKKGIEISGKTEDSKPLFEKEKKGLLQGIFKKEKSVHDNKAESVRDNKAESVRDNREESANDNKTGSEKKEVSEKNSLGIIEKLFGKKTGENKEGKKGQFENQAVEKNKGVKEKSKGFSEQQKKDKAEPDFWNSKPGDFWSEKKSKSITGLFGKKQNALEKEDFSENQGVSEKEGLEESEIKKIVSDFDNDEEKEQVKKEEEEITSELRRLLEAEKQEENTVVSQKPLEQDFKSKPVSAGKKAKGRASEISIIIIPNREYLKATLVLVRELSQKYNKICYVSLNELYDEIINNFEKSGIDVKKFFFIDAITKTSRTIPEKKKDCIFVSSPNSLIELSLAITETLNKENPDLLIFDSLSTLLIYEKESTVTKFIHSLIGKIRANNTDCYMTALEGDVQNESIKDLGMFVNEVQSMTEFELYKMGGAPVEEMGVKQKTSPNLLKALAEIKSAPNQRPEQPDFFAESNIKGEMEKLKKRLSDVAEKPSFKPEFRALQKKLDKMQKTPKVIYSPKLTEKQLEKIEEKIENLEKKPVAENTPKIIQQEFKKIAERLDVLQKKPVKKDVTPAIKKELENLSKKISRIEKKTSAKNSGGIEKHLKKLESKISEMEKKPKSRKEVKGLLEKIEKEKMPAMPKNNLKKLEKKLDGIEKRLKKAEKKHEKELEKKEKVLEKKKQEIEKKQDKSAKEIERLEKKLALLNKSYNLGIISEVAYKKDKAKIEELLRKDSKSKR
jgi:archaellum biogenesis ATPase FlaH